MRERTGTIEHAVARVRMACVRARVSVVCVCARACVCVGKKCNTQARLILREVRTCHNHSIVSISNMPKNVLFRSQSTSQVTVCI